MKKIRRRIRNLHVDAQRAGNVAKFEADRRAGVAPLVRTKTVKETLYLFDQLIAAGEQGLVSSSAVERARTWLQEGLQGYDWFEYTIETWTTALAQLGFENAKIQFTGFCSQGDGASFETDDVCLAKLIGFMLSDCAPENCIKANPNRPDGQQEDFWPYVKHKLGFKDPRYTSDRYDRLLWFDDGETFCEAKVERICNQYSHWNTCRFLCEFHDRGQVDDNYKFTADHPRIYNLFQRFREDAESLRKDLCRVIYTALEEEHEYLNSDEALIETAQANEYYFNEHGRRIEL